ncbi:MAG: FMN-dependent NADH-azoreductase, partial [Yoonia sp.]
YESGSPVGLLTNKKAIIVPASGGVPAGSSADHLTPHLKTFLAFLGITDVTITAAT